MKGTFSMIILIPLVFLTICAVVKQHTGDRVTVLSRGILLYELLIIVVTNILSLTHTLTEIGAAVAFLIVLFIFCILYGYGAKDMRIIPQNPFKRLKQRVKTWFWDLSKAEKIMSITMLLLLAVLALILLFGAIFTVPYNYDSMSYHLARIAYWMDHKSVAHYVTNIDRQVYSPVLAEYNLLYFYLLTGSDTFLNMLQYLCFFFAGYFIYESCRRLGTGKLFSLFGTFAFMMMPLTISQSITTQNDLFATLLFSIFVYELIGVIKLPHITLNKEQLAAICALGLSVAFAYMAKTSVCASMLMFMPWLLIVRLAKKDRFKNLFGCVAVAVVSILLPLSETLLRTLKSSGKLMTDTASGDIMVATKNVSYIIINILKNYCMLITQNYVRALNGFMYRIPIHLAVPLKVEVNNEAIAFHGFDFINHMNMGDDMYSHDKTPSAFVAYLALLAGVALMVLLVKQCVVAIRNRKVRKEQEVFAMKQDSLDAQSQKNEQYIKDDPAWLVIGFGISAWLSLGFIMALLRWQPWGTRLMYPALAMTVIMSASVLDLCFKKAKTMVWTLILSVLLILCVLLAIPSIQYNLADAVSFAASGCENRINQYFKYNHRESSYAKLISLGEEDQVKDIGLVISGDGFDYPLWLMQKEEYEQGKLRHIVLDGDYEAEGFDQAPDCIYMIERDVLTLGDEITYAGTKYVCIYVNEDNGDSYLRKEE